ncbi:MAG: TonB-dependent receptor [Sphingobium sp.]|nr:TonB-dependent receptor [Sphingobium sp.]
MATAWLLLNAAAARAEAADDNDDKSTIIVTGIRQADLQTNTPTGSRLGLSILETPASLNVVDGDAIRLRGDALVIDAVTRAPGVTSTGNPGNGGTSLSMRGFNGQGSVLQLFNGLRLFPVAGTITFPSDPWNIARIEVLSGPASVLYGQGALGGAVNVIPKQPNSSRFEAQADVGYGSQNSWHASGGAGGPIGSGFSFRADASYRKSDGYVARGDSDNLALSGALRFAPNDQFSVTLRDDYGEFHPMKYFGTPLINSQLDTSIRGNNYNVSDAEMHFRDNRLALTLDWNVSDAITINNTAYYLTSKRKWRNLETYCWIAANGDCPNNIGFGTPGNIYRADNFGIVHDQEQYGEQGTVKWSAPLGGMVKNDLLIGIDVSRVNLTYSHDFGSDYQEDEVPKQNFNPGLFLDTQGIAPRYRTTTDTFSLFAEDRLALSEQLSIVGGVRYERNKVGRWNFVYTGSNITGETPALNGGTAAYKTLSHTTWRVGMVYEPTKNLSFYAQYATAVDPLGTLTTYSTSGTQFQLTNADGYQYEAGVKGVFLEGKGSFTVAAYRLVKKNLFGQPRNNGVITAIGQRSSQGVEASLTMELPGGFAIDANGTVLDANYDDFVPYNGNTPPGVPETAANLELRWSGLKSFQVRGNLRYVGDRFSDDANIYRVPGYVVVDAGLTYAVTPNVGIDLRVTNLFDKNYALTTYNDEQWILGRPRSFDVSLRANF